MLLTAVKAHMGLIPINFTVLSECFSQELKLFFVCHTATLTNFLCYTSVSRVQGKSASLRFSNYSVVSLTTDIIGLFLHRKRLLYADHKGSAIDLSIMIHDPALRTVSMRSMTFARHRRLMLLPVSR